jgi:cytochrome c553
LVRDLAAAPILLAVLALTPAQVGAQAPAPAAPANAVACQSCHGKDGISASASIPNLAGQKANYLVAQLKAFKAGDRKNDLMKAIAGQLGDDDMKGLAQYWSALPAAPVDGHAAGARVIASRMSFPASFPAGFTLFKTDGDGDTITERYANAVAVKAARAGQPLPDGSVILAVNHKAATDAAGKRVPGEITGYTGQASQAGWGADIPELLRNGNWDYALFSADKTRRELNQAQCMACHKPIAADSYVFNLKALHEAAAKGG